MAVSLLAELTARGMQPDVMSCLDVQGVRLNRGTVEHCWINKGNQGFGLGCELISAKSDVPQPAWAMSAGVEVLSFGLPNNGIVSEATRKS